MNSKGEIDIPKVVEVEAPEYIYPEKPVRGQRAKLNLIDDAPEIQISKEELIERYAQIQGIDIKEALERVDAPTKEEVLKNIENQTIEKIRSTQVPLNRAQRRALKKKLGTKKYAEMVTENGNEVAAISEAATKLNYINLIQKLRKLNEEKAQNEYDDDEEN